MGRGCCNCSLLHSDWSAVWKRKINQDLNFYLQPCFCDCKCMKSSTAASSFHLVIGFGLSLLKCQNRQDVVSCGLVTLYQCAKKRGRKTGRGKVAGIEREREEKLKVCKLSSPVGNTALLNYTSLVLALFAVLCLLFPADAPLMPHRPWPLTYWERAS